MTEEQAEQIASLLNRRNQLTRRYQAADVLASADEYEFFLGNEGKMIGCVQVKNIQWYQAEVCHLTLDEGAEGQGYARLLIEKAEANAIRAGRRIVQCTVRCDNDKSMARFVRLGYREACRFHNSFSNNDVSVLQKVLVPIEDHVPRAERH